MPDNLPPLSVLCTHNTPMGPMGNETNNPIIIPFINTSQIRSTKFRPLFKFFYWLLVADFIILGWVGQKPVTTIYVLIGQIATFYYFLFFIFLIPFIEINKIGK